MNALVNVAKTDDKEIVFPTVWTFDEESQLRHHLNDCLKWGAVNYGAMSKYGEELFPCSIKCELSATTITRSNILLSVEDMVHLLMGGWSVTNYYDKNDPQIDHEAITRKVCKMREMK